MQHEEVGTQKARLSARFDELLGEGVMECELADNRFCRSLTEEHKRLLCGRCRHKKYPAGTRLPLAHWERGVVILAGGLTVLLRSDSAGANIEPSSQYMTAGSLISWGFGKARPSNEPYVGCDVLCLRDCTFAMLDVEETDYLKKHDTSFLMAFMSEASCLTGRFISYNLCRNTYEKVCLVLRDCKEAGITDLTHRELAVICGCSRSLVTKAIQQAIAERPDLF